jgi:flagellar motor switch protein FliN
MSDMTFQNTLVLRDFFNQLMPSVSVAFSEQINREVSLTVVDVQTVPMLSLQERIDIVLETTFSLNYPKSVESLLYFSESTALILNDIHQGKEGDIPSDMLTDDQVEVLGDVMTGVLRGFATAVGNHFGEPVDVETNSTVLGSIALPPVFALEPNAIEAVISMSIPGVTELEMFLLLTPELAGLLAPEAVSGIDDMLSSDEIAKMMSGLGAGGANTGFSGSEMAPMGLGGAAFPNFGGGVVSETAGSRPIDLIMDIPLEVTVELGRIRMLIKDVLDLASGSIVELDRVAGEPVDLLVNGRLVAKGEVVVIEDNFGIRITEIVSPAERVAGLGKHR